METNADARGKFRPPGTVGQNPQGSAMQRKDSDDAILNGLSLDIRARIERQVDCLLLDTGIGEGPGGPDTLARDMVMHNALSGDETRRFLPSADLRRRADTLRRRSQQI